MITPKQAYIKFEPRDIWIGVYWDYTKSNEIKYHALRIYICIIPCLPICLAWQWE